eukprot:scaffold19800_cov17-Tisochrysis_lutea.AAC.1
MQAKNLRLKNCGGSTTLSPHTTQQERDTKAQSAAGYNRQPNSITSLKVPQTALKLCYDSFQLLCSALQIVPLA